MRSLWTGFRASRPRELKKPTPTLRTEEATRASENPNEITIDEARIRELMLMNLFAVFNERDRERRLKAIAANYTEDVIWTDPERTFHGHEALNERAQELLDELPALVFTAAGPVHVLRDLGHLVFTHGPPQQSPAITGYDVALVKGGRIAVLYALVNPGGRRLLPCD